MKQHYSRFNTHRRSNYTARMDWVRTFYRKQHEWSGVCAATVESWHREKAAALRLPARPGPYQILELGCGGGQMAVALAELGHQVVAIDLLPEAIACAKALAAQHQIQTIDWVEGDFYDFHSERQFDEVCYWDGFGIGTDRDQSRLLRRITSWLKQDGCAHIEVYTPWYWRQAAGRTMAWPDVSRAYGYDEENERMLDTWWPTGSPEASVTQSLRCYAPHELEALLDGLPLQLDAVTPCGAVDPTSGTFDPDAPLEKAMQYLAVLSPAEAEPTNAEDGTAP